MMALLCDRGVRTPPVYQVEVRRSFYDALPVSALVDLMTLTFDLETGAYITARGLGNLPILLFL